MIFSSTQISKAGAVFIVKDALMYMYQQTVIPSDPESNISEKKIAHMHIKFKQDRMLAQ